MFRLSAFVLLAPVALAMGTGAVRAADPAEKLDEIGRIHVAYDDLDLRKETDARALLDRLEKAAFQACGGDPRFHPSYATMPRRTTEVFSECRERAVRSAVAQINAPTLHRALDP